MKLLVFRFFLPDRISDNRLVTINFCGPRKTMLLPEFFNLNDRNHVNYISLICIQYQNDNELNLRFFKFEFHLNFLAKKVRFFRTGFLAERGEKWNLKRICVYIKEGTSLYSHEYVASACVYTMSRVQISSNLLCD